MHSIYLWPVAALLCICTILIPLVPYAAATPQKNDMIDSITDVVEIASDQIPTAKFPCQQMKDVCANMCFGIKCLNMPSILTWDNPDKQERKSRRRAAGCTSPNKCNKGQSGPGHRGPGFTSCDEYPFATTSEAGGAYLGKQVTRCVPQNENNYRGRQGGILRGVYEQLRQQRTDTFTLRFDNVQGVPYCARGSSCDNSAGLEIQQGQPAAALKKREEQSPAINFRYYRTKSGANMATMEEYSVGDVVERVLDDNEKLPDGFPTKELEGEIYVEDVIAEELDEIPEDDSAVAY